MFRQFFRANFTVLQQNLDIELHRTSVLYDASYSLKRLTRTIDHLLVIFDYLLY